MLNNKRRKVALVAIMIFSLIAAYGFLPAAKAASLESAKDTLSDSSPETVTTHTILFDMGTALSPTEYVKVTFEAGQFDTSNMTAVCPNDGVVTDMTTTTDEVVCTVRGGQTLASTSAQTITVTGIGNPDTEGDYDVFISTHNALDEEIESSGVKVYVISAVTITATVPATLTFGIAAVNPASSTNSVNGITVTSTSTPTALSFGTLDPNASSTVGHHLTVTTNADSGYAVTIEQGGELSNAAGATINSFNNSHDDVGSTTPQPWEAPHANLDDDWTYGHMGITSDDEQLFTGAQFIGLNASDPFTVMSHSGPADGVTQSIGSVRVAYSVQISALQEAGDYTANLTYICTPTY